MTPPDDMGGAVPRRAFRLPDALAGLAERRQFVAWREERPRPDRPIKVPYDPRTGAKAESDNPATWGTFAEAQRAVKRVVRNGTGGIGIMFDDLGDSQALCGIDLDTCRSPDGSIAGWAAATIREFDTYTEVSPSGTGVKLFFRVATADVDAAKAEIAPSKWSKSWKYGVGFHPPAIELHLGRRFYTVTGEAVPGTPAMLNAAPLARILHLIREAGPRFAAGEGEASASDRRRQPLDGSRSGIAFRLGRAAVRNGATYEEMVEAIEEDPVAAEWVEEKGRADGERELLRIWNKAQPDVGTVSDLVEEFNLCCAVVNEAGKTVVFSERKDISLGRTVYDRMTFEDFRRLHLNRLVNTGETRNGTPVRKPAGAVWLEHLGRRQYANGVTFDPSGKNVPQGMLNLWRGFAVQPSPGDWSRLREHIATVVCRDNPQDARYLFRWMARLFQYPDQTGEVAVVLRGGEGSGKGILARALLHICGQHGLHIASAKHLVGTFNSHLRDVVLLFADEAFFAGDKAHVGTLKALVTEPTMTIEAKYANAVQARNHLKVMMASNEDWVVPASLDSRRFFVLDVNDNRRGDHAYFRAITTQLDEGGHAAMLHDLLAMDLACFNVRDVPVTEALQEQRKRSLPTLTAWWLECLEEGSLFSDEGNWREEVPTSDIMGNYHLFARSRNERRVESRENVGKFMKKMGATPKRLTVGGQRPQGYVLGTLEEARLAFVKETGLSVIWDGGDEV